MKFFWIFVGIDLMILLLTWNNIEWGNTEKIGIRFDEQNKDED